MEQLLFAFHWNLLQFPCWWRTRLQLIINWDYCYRWLIIETVFVRLAGGVWFDVESRSTQLIEIDVYFLSLLCHYYYYYYYYCYLLQLSTFGSAWVCHRHFPSIDSSLTVVKEWWVDPSDDSWRIRGHIHLVSATVFETINLKGYFFFLRMKERVQQKWCKGRTIITGLKSCMLDAVWYSPRQNAKSPPLFYFPFVSAFLSFSVCLFYFYISSSEVAFVKCC